MQHMMHMARGEQDDMFKDSHSVIVNSNHPTIAQKLVAMEDESTKQQLATYLLELALLEQQMLKGAALTDFVKRSLEKI